MHYKALVDCMSTKRLIIFGLSLLAAAICLSGVIFAVFSWINDISFKVINTNVPGILFGATVAYLGLRNFLSVTKLKNELYKDTAVFTWSNFKKQKNIK